jgi:hypothetical protein
MSCQCTDGKSLDQVFESERATGFMQIGLRVKNDSMRLEVERDTESLLYASSHEVWFDIEARTYLGLSAVEHHLRFDREGKAWFDPTRRECGAQFDASQRCNLASRCRD